MGRLCSACEITPLLFENCTFWEQICSTYRILYPNPIKIGLGYKRSKLSSSAYQTSLMQSSSRNFLWLFLWSLKCYKNIVNFVLFLVLSQEILMFLLNRMILNTNKPKESLASKFLHCRKIWCNATKQGHKIVLRYKHTILLHCLMSLKQEK